jgi:ABC-type glycerol-3-phosphate transport system permease component
MYYLSILNRQKARNLLIGTYAGILFFPPVGVILAIYLLFTVRKLTDSKPVRYLTYLALPLTLMIYYLLFIFLLAGE